VAKFVGFMRRVLESEERNGQYLRGLNIDSRHSLEAMRLFEKHAIPADKEAIANFINRQEAVMSGSTGSGLYPREAGSEKGTEALLRKLDNIKPAGETEGTTTVSKQLEQLLTS